MNSKFQKDKKDYIFVYNNNLKLVQNFKRYGTCRHLIFNDYDYIICCYDKEIYQVDLNTGKEELIYKFYESNDQNNYYKSYMDDKLRYETSLSNRDAVFIENGLKIAIINQFDNYTHNVNEPIIKIKSMSDGRLVCGISDSEIYIYS